MNYTKAFVEKVGKKTGVLESVVISDETVDRHGDVLEIGDWDFKNYLTNPVVLDQHGRGTGSSKQVIGKNLSLKVEDNQLKAQPQFAVKENPDAKIIHDLYKGGYLKAFSVGFISRREGEKVTNELLEFSAVSIPANPSALIEIRSKGLIPVDIDGNEIEDIGDLVMNLTAKCETVKLRAKRKYLNWLDSFFN